MKNYTLKDTKNPDVKRMVDLSGNWQWYYHVPTKRYLRGTTTILDKGYAKGERLYEYLKKGTPEEIERKLSEASDHGDAVHQAISQILETGKASKDMKVFNRSNNTERQITIDEWKDIICFINFWKIHEPKLIDSEYTVENLTHGYAGTYDAIIRITKACGVKSCPCSEIVNKTLLVDWKTSGGMYSSYEAQVASYANSVPNKVDYTGILRLGTKHITTKGCEFKIWNSQETKENFSLFLSSLMIAEKEWPMFDEKIIEEIPESFDVEVNKETQGIQASEVIQKQNLIKMKKGLEVISSDFMKSNEKPKRKIIRKKNAKISKN